MAALDAANFAPEAEHFPDPEPAVASRQVLIAVERVEKKLNLLIQHHDILLPDAIDPDILSADAKKLADENRKVEAVSLHRSRTGAEFARSVDLINRYLRQSKK